MNQRDAARMIWTYRILMLVGLFAVIGGCSLNRGEIEQWLRISLISVGVVLVFFLAPYLKNKAHDWYLSETERLRRISSGSQ